MPDIFLFGMQGSGKGTQSQILASRFGMRIFETGGALRSIVKEGGPLGHKVQSIIDAGNLVPNDVIMEILSDFLDKTPADTPIIIDGTPRFLEQMHTTDIELTRVHRAPLAVHIHLSHDEALRRLLGRRTCSACGAIWGPDDHLAVTDPCPRCSEPALKVRADDTEVAIQRRITLFQQETMPVIAAYAAQGRVLEIEGTLPKDEVTAAIIQGLEGR